MTTHGISISFGGAKAFSGGRHSFIQKKNGLGKKKKDHARSSFVNVYRDGGRQYDLTVTETLAILKTEKKKKTGGRYKAKAPHFQQINDVAGEKGKKRKKNGPIKIPESVLPFQRKWQTHTHTCIVKKKKRKQVYLSSKLGGHGTYTLLVLVCFSMHDGGITQVSYVDEEEEGDGISISERRKVNK